jgi:hypothetical protein
VRGIALLAGLCWCGLFASGVRALSLSDACRDTAGSVQRSFDEADAVFIGTVVDRVTDRQRGDLPQTASSVQLKLEIERNYKGTQRELWLYYEDWNNEPAPFLGSRLLLFASESEGRWYFMYCSASRVLRADEEPDMGGLKPIRQHGCGRCALSRERGAGVPVTLLAVPLVLLGRRRPCATRAPST